MLQPGDPRIPERRNVPLGLSPDADRRRTLWVRGRLTVLGAPTIGIVGTRRPSAHGVAAARRIAHDVARAGWAVVSGLALGIDEAAHRAALEVRGTTIAVLPSPAPLGVRQGARHLAEQIADSGLLLSDQAIGTPPARWSFAARNHLLAGMCDGLIVIEAPEGSGALITAESAADLAIPVAVVSAPYGATTAAGGLRWLQHGRELSLRLAEEAPRVLIAGADDLRAWLAVCALSLRDPTFDGVPRLTRAWDALYPVRSKLQEEILARLDSVGAAGASEGDLVDLSPGSSGAIVAALTMLSSTREIEQRGGRWRRVPEAMLRSRP